VPETYYKSDCKLALKWKEPYHSSLTKHGIRKTQKTKSEIADINSTSVGGQGEVRCCQQQKTEFVEGSIV